MTSNTLKPGSALPEPHGDSPTDGEFEACLSKKLAPNWERVGDYGNWSIRPNGAWIYNYACHGGWSGHVNKTHRYIVNALDTAHLESKDLEMLPQFIEWMIYHSPWHACIDPRLTVELAVEHKLIIADLRYPSQYVHGMNLLVRTLNEHPTVYSRWCTLMRTGKFDGTFSFICAVKFRGGGSTIGGSQHGCPINQYLSINSIKNLLGHKAVNYIKEPVYRSRTYAGVNRVFEGGAPYDKKIFAKEMNEIIKKGELKEAPSEPQKKPDPFGRKDPSEIQSYGDAPIGYGNDTVKAAKAFKIWLISKGVSFP